MILNDWLMKQINKNFYKIYLELNRKNKYE